MPMDQHYFTESWKDVQGCGGVQDLPYSVQGCGGVQDLPYSVQGWGSGHSSPSASSQPNGSVDKELYRSLVEMIPLVESFMDQRGNKSFSHRASPIYTPTPRDWSSRKMAEQKGRKTLETGRTTKQRESKEAALLNHYENIDTQNAEQLSDEQAICSSRSLGTEGQPAGGESKLATLSDENRETILQLQNQVEALEKKLAEKDELLKSAEDSIRQINSMQLQKKVEELQQQVHEKDNLIKSAHIQLYDKKKELADLRSLLAKAEEDAKASNQKSQKVEEELEGLQRQIAAFILFFDAAEKAAANSDVQGMNSTEDLELDPNFSIPDSDANGLCKESAEEDHNGFCQLDETEVQDIEQARRKYLAAVIAAKNNPGEESMSLAADLRLQLQQFLLRPALANALDDQLSVQVLGFTAA